MKRMGCGTWGNGCETHPFASHGDSLVERRVASSRSHGANGTPPTPSPPPLDTPFEPPPSATHSLSYPLSRSSATASPPTNAVALPSDVLRHGGDLHNTSFGEECKPHVRPGTHFRFSAKRGRKWALTSGEESMGSDKWGGMGAMRLTFRGENGCDKWGRMSAMRLNE